MPRSLTVLLPVHNAQSTLATHVSGILEIVSELTDRFELLIIDDGSSDATGEIAQELSRRYPQIRTIYHNRQRGREAAVRTGLRHCRGEVVFVEEADTSPALEGIRSLWQTADEHAEVAVSAPPRTSSAASQATTGRIRRLAGYQMIDLRESRPGHHPSQPARPNFLSRLKRFALNQ